MKRLEMLDRSELLEQVRQTLRDLNYKFQDTILYRTERDIRFELWTGKRTILIEYFLERDLNQKPTQILKERC